MILDTPLSPAKYRDLSRRAEFYRQVIERILQLPGVISAAYVNFPPLTMKGGSSGFLIDGRPRPKPGEMPDADNRVATSDYLRTIGVPLLRGRLYTDQDGPDSPRVIVINQTMARLYWPGEDALGARIRFGEARPDQPAYTVIGIVRDVKQMGLNVPARQEMYSPAIQPSPGGPFFWPGVLVVRAAADPLLLAPQIRRVIASVDPDQPIADIRTMNEILDHEVSDRQTGTMILAAFAIAALLLASVGLYGVLSYSVAQRTAEIGLRIALGAQRGDLILGVMIRSLVLTAGGVALGIAGAFGVTRVFAALLFHTSPSDPRTFVCVALLLFSLAMLASFVPARRSATIDPILALRHE